MLMWDILSGSIEPHLVQLEAVFITEKTRRKWHVFFSRSHYFRVTLARGHRDLGNSQGRIDRPIWLNEVFTTTRGRTVSL